MNQLSGISTEAEFFATYDQLFCHGQGRGDMWILPLLVQACMQGPSTLQERFFRHAQSTQAFLQPHGLIGEQALGRRSVGAFTTVLMPAPSLRCAGVI